jgi:predicted DNA-binding transcriptional regulator AlpA
MDAKTKTVAAESIGLSPEHAAAGLSISRDLLDSLVAQGKAPMPLSLGGRKVFNRAELQAWLDAGAPDRKAWEKLKAVAAIGGRRYA